MRRLSEKQISIINVVKKRNADGTNLDLDQIIDAVEYSVTKQALQFSLRFLIKRGLLEKSSISKRRGRNRVTYIATSKAYEENL